VTYQRILRIQEIENLAAILKALKRLKNQLVAEPNFVPAKDLLLEITAFDAKILIAQII